MADNRIAEDSLLLYMIKNNIELTREKYLELAYWDRNVELLKLGFLKQ